MDKFIRKHWPKLPANVLKKVNVIYQIFYFHITPVSLCSEITSKRKAFTAPALSKPINKEVEGEVSLQKYQDVVSRAEYVEELQQYGLTEDEIEIKLKHEGLDNAGKVRICVILSNSINLN